MTRKWRDLAIRSLLLFLLSTLLVAGFWFHGAFYEFGLYPLLLLGGLLVFLVILAFRYVVTAPSFAGRPRRRLALSPEEADRVVRGTTPFVLLSARRTDLPRAGELVAIHYATNDRRVGKVRIADAYRRYRKDLTAGETTGVDVSEGAASPGSEEGIVHILEVDVVEGRS
jgi:hypothetical protein